MNIKTVTVIGANGTMGCNVSAIFASFGNAKVYMVSRDMEKSKKAAIKAGNSVKASSIMNNLIPADYSMLDQCVSQSDLVFESVAENWEAHAYAADPLVVLRDSDSSRCGCLAGVEEAEPGAVGRVCISDPC